MSHVQDIPLEQYGVFTSDPQAVGCEGSRPEGWAFKKLGNDEVGITCVSMDPGCRSAWHKHSNGSHVVVCVAGKALLQVQGEELVELSAGDTASVPAEVAHWHGAAPDSRTQFLIVHAHPEGLAHEYLEPVE